MSQYIVTYHASGSVENVLAGAAVAYDYYPYAAKEFPDKREFLDLAVSEYSTCPLLVCTHNGLFAGFLILNPMCQDIHVRGTGMNVLAICVAPNEPGVLNILLNKLRHLVQQEGGVWFSIPQRISQFETMTRYRRFRNG